MGQDVLRGRRTEIDHINGLVVAGAEATGTAAPGNRAVLDIVRAIERGRLTPAPDRLAGVAVGPG
ncbi:hypothetical protein [Azospirillum argentinense]|uniref:ketopantoate reductase C-terminal domain-containing protein n=1 Tax=Azospirillum argentinense TaxID=2970906 RepID=UPI0032DFD1C7